ncbi:hypothetical protein Dimus_005433 [Dionaea muscipula]
MGQNSLVSQTRKAILAIGDYMNIRAHAYIGGKSVGEDIRNWNMESMLYPEHLAGGLSDKCRKHLKHQRDCANQIHKAAMAINNHVLNEMKVPESYMAGLPKV